MSQKNWDKYEVALLIEAYQDIKQGRVDKNAALITLSQNLRRKAENEGLEIDVTFRNLNGMQWQLGFIEKAFVNGEFESRVPPKIFVEMVALYNDDSKEFQAVLKEAHRKVEGKVELNDETRKEKFIEWLSGNVVGTSFDFIVENINYVSEYAVKRKISKYSFWSYSDYREFNRIRVAISGNKLFKVLHGREHRQFEKNGKLYADFLRELQIQAVSVEPVAEAKETQTSCDVASTAATATPNAVVKGPVIAQPAEQILDLSSIPELSYSKPIFASFKGIEIDTLNWKMVYISILNLLYRVYSSRLNNYCGKSLCGGSRIDLSFRSSDLILPKLISSQYPIYAESNLSANDIAKRLVSVLNICGVEHSNLVIKYKTKAISTDENIQVESKNTVLEKKRAITTQPENSDRDIISRYTKWLMEERNMSENTSRGYGSSLRGADVKAKELGILTDSLFDVSDENLQEVITKILSDTDFANYNAEQHNRFSAALNAYLMFKTGQRIFGLRVRRMQKQPKEEVVCPDDLKFLLLRKFPYGIRIDSEIDMMKLKNFADMFEVNLPKDDEVLKTQIDVAGVPYEGKLYFPSNEFVDSLMSKVSDILDEGYSVVYYEELFRRDFEWFDENHISAWELVREILDKQNVDLFIGKNFLRKGVERLNEADAVEIEMESVWGDVVVHTYDEMYELLPYIPDEKIKFYLSYSLKFVWSTHETFVWIDKLIITDEEKQAIIEYVKNECELTGHASIANVPLGNIEEENYQISVTAIYDAIYNLILKDDYAINGKILTKNDGGVDALTLAKTYCSGKESCSFNELNDYVVSINGTENRQITFHAAYDQLVRATKDKFVADGKVHFDVDAIDEILDGIVGEDIVSIKSVATFVMFPDCGLSWTHYILESFCYRFSKKYRLEVINFNDRNAGIIAKKEINMNYTEMLAIVAVRSGLELRADIIGEYLYDNGYIARRRSTLINSVIEKAIQMKEVR